MKYFQDKIVIVTGGASGIGNALCRGLAQRKAKAIVVADVHMEKARNTAKEIAQYGLQTQAAVLDVSNAYAFSALIDSVISQHGRLDCLFNNAGIAVRGEFRDMNLEHWKNIINVNLWGVVHGCTYAYQAMVRQGFGHIVNISSVAGLVPLPIAAAYSATKHAVVGLSNSLRTEGAGLGVRVSVACPGFVRTDLFDASLTVTMHGDSPAFPIQPRYRIMSAEKCAHEILEGVSRNRAIITVSRFAGLLWLVNRISPALTQRLFLKRIRRMRVSRHGL